MAVANPCIPKDFAEWKKEMEENRRRRWRERVSRLAKVKVSDDEEQEEAGDADCEEDEVSEDEVEEVNEEEEEEMEVREAEDTEEEKNEVQREVKEIKRRDDGENREVVEVDERVDEREEESEVERGVKQNEEVNEDEEKAGKTEEEGEKEGGNEVEREVEGNKKVDEVEEMKEEQEQGDSEVGKEVEVDAEEEKDVSEVEEVEEEEIEVENEVEREVKEKEEVEEKEVTEADVEEELEGENKFEREVKELEDGGGDGGNEVEIEVEVDEEEEAKKAEELEEGEEEGGNEVEREVEENKKVDEVEFMKEEQEQGDSEEGKQVDAEEEKDVSEAEEVEEEEIEVEGEVKEKEEVEEKEVTEAGDMEEELEGDNEELEDGGGDEENEVEIEVEVDEEEDVLVREEEQVKGTDDGEEEHQEQARIGQYRLTEQLREQMRRTEDEDFQLNQKSTRQEHETVNEDSGSEESDNEDSDVMGSEDECYDFERLKDEEGAAEKQRKDPEELEDPNEKSWRNENSIPGAWTSEERREQEGESEKLRDETVAESWTTQEEEFQDNHEKLQEEEEESTDDEEAEHSEDEDASDSDEDVVKIYCKDDSVTEVFLTLEEFRSSSLLTDLTLSTEDGKCFQVHFPVLAAVSTLIRESLSRCNIGNERVDERKDDDASVGIHRRSLSLGPEVDHVGLEAVVEFAYTGLISCLSEDTLHQIKAAAQTLGVPRVLDICTEEEETYTKTVEKKKKERISAAEQMVISLQSMKQLWMDRVGCDVILEALGGSLHVHRVILAVWSDYFRSMFTLGMKESHQPRVTLPFLSASELEVLIDCSYSGALPLSWKCVFEITSTALQLQYQPALSLCLNFLQQEINPHSCLDVASFAEAYEMVHLLEVADDYVLRQFQKVACTSKFKDLPYKQLLKYLDSHSLCVPSELVVFKAVVAWIQAKPEKRLKLAKQLMKTIHFPLMTFKEFKEVQSQDIWSDHSMVELFESIVEDFCSNETTLQSQCRIYLPKESLVLIGGDQTSEDLGSRSISRELWFGNSLRNHIGIKKAMEWRKLGEMPEPARFRHEVTVLKGQLYVFGGKRYYGLHDTLNSVYRYDPLQNTWESLAGMQEKRCSFSVVVLAGMIYAIGGHCDPEYRESVEQYCPTANSWRFTRPLDLPLSGHVAKVLHGQIFISGGLNDDYQCLASMFLYHPETGSTYLSNMAKPRAHHCMETLGECLYVAGGVTIDGNMTILDQLACEVYNPAADSWTAFTSLPVPHVGAGSAVLEGKFYVLGGYSQEDYSDTKMVHRYDPTLQRWENMGKMPGPNNDIRASLLCLPPHFRL